MTGSNNKNLAFAYGVKEILFEEGIELINEKMVENRETWWATGSEFRKEKEKARFGSNATIEERKLCLVDLQARLREEVNQEKQDIISMPDRPYREFVRLCKHQRMELARQAQVFQRPSRAKQLKSISNGERSSGTLGHS